MLLAALGLYGVLSHAVNQRLAALIPASRASHVDPVVALRSDG
jgi:ABC-type lipoprotein release transport system permease subunit